LQGSRFFTDITDAVIQGNLRGLRTAFEDEKNKDILFGSSFWFTPPRHLSRNSKEFIPCKELTLLHIAAYFDNLESFIFLVNNGFKLRAPSASSYLPLHYACVGNAKEVASYILESDPEQATMDCSVQYQPINLAIYANSPEILKMLFAKGADIHSPMNVKGKPLEQALKSRDFDCLLILLENKYKTNVSAFSLTPLMLAIVSGMGEAVGPLLDRGISPRSINKGYSALSYACMMEEESVVKLLCSRMEDIEIPITDERHPSIATAAVHSKNPEILRVVLEKGCDVNRYDKNGLLPAHALIGISNQQTSVDMLEMLINAGFKVNNRQNEKSLRFLEELLIKYTYQDFQKLVEVLLRRGADPKLQMPDGKTLLEHVRGFKNSNSSLERKYYSIFNHYFPNSLE
jgi:ankyrin repeat protein